MRRKLILAACVMCVGLPDAVVYYSSPRLNSAAVVRSSEAQTVGESSSPFVDAYADAQRRVLKRIGEYLTFGSAVTAKVPESAETDDPVRIDVVPR